MISPSKTSIASFTIVDKDLIRIHFFDPRFRYLKLRFFQIVLMIMNLRKFQTFPSVTKSLKFFNNEPTENFPCRVSAQKIQSCFGCLRRTAEDPKAP